MYTHTHTQAPTYSHSAVIDFSQLNTAQHQPVLLTAQAGQRGEDGGGGVVDAGDTDAAEALLFNTLII